MFDLPYQSQLIPLSAILAEIGDAWEHETVRSRLTQWYWNGVIGELYGSAVDTRIAKDFMEVPDWALGRSSAEPTTIRDTIFRADRLRTMRMRLSAAYKGVNALLMQEGARDFALARNSTTPSSSARTWTSTTSSPGLVRGKKDQGGRLRFHHQQDSARLSHQSRDRCDAPSIYLNRLENGSADRPTIHRDNLDASLSSHLIAPGLLRSDQFEAFMADRQARLLALIEKATGKSSYRGDVAEEGQMRSAMMTAWRPSSPSRWRNSAASLDAKQQVSCYAFGPQT